MRHFTSYPGHAFAVICGILSVGASDAAPVQTMTEMVVADKAPDPFRAETVTGATGTELASELSPQTVNVLTRNLLEATNVDNLDEALAYDTSVSSGGSTLYSRTAGQYSIRGYSGSDVTLQGMPLPDGMGIVLDSSLIEQVEVVKGPIGSLEGGQTSTMGPYGAGGSIVLNLKQPLMENVTDIMAYTRLTEGGGQKYRLVGDNNRVWNRTNGQLGMRTIFVGEYEHPFWLKGGADGGQKYVISPSFLWKPDSRTKISLNLSFQYIDMPAYQGIPVLGGQFVGPYNAWYGGPLSRDEYKGALMQVNLEKKLDSTWTIRTGAGLGYSDVDYNLWALSSGAPNRKVSALEYYNSVIATGKGYYEYAWSDTRSTNWNVYGQALAKVRTGTVAHEILLGADYTGRNTNGHGYFGTTNQLFDLWNPEPPVPTGRDYGVGTKSSRTLHRTGLTLQELASWNGWKFLAGMRVDAHFSAEGNTGFSVSPRAGISKEITDHIVWFGNLARTEAPNFNYKDASDKEMTSSWEANQYESGLRFNPFGSLWINASWFMIEQSHTPELLPGDRSHYYDNGKSRSKGVEISLTGNITKAWSSYASYTFMQYKDIDAGQSFDRYAPHAVSLWQQYEVQGGFLTGTKLGLGYRFRDSSLATLRGEKIADNYTIPSYNVFDCSVEVPLPATRWFAESSIRFAVYNIFNEKYVASSRHAVQCFVGDPRTFEICFRSRF